jgi:glycosyltransferase involved in cell wall biosynthesis
MLENCLTLLANNYPAHHFIFIFDKPYDAASITEKNITAVQMGPLIRNRLLLHYWYQFKLPRFLEKNKVDIFINADLLCCFRTNVSQCMIIPDLAFLQKKIPTAASENRYRKKYFGRSLQKASMLAVMNESLREPLQSKYKVSTEKISYIPISIDIPEHPVSETEKSNIKTTLAGGHEYFLYFATPSSMGNIIHLLKAFSIFKKWQKSSMQLLILFDTPINGNEIPGFSNYKYREEVKPLYLENSSDRPALIAAAYACICMPTIGILETGGMESFAHAVPIISNDLPYYHALYANGALFTDEAEKNIAEKMMRLYKDENLRNNLAAHAKSIRETHRRELAAKSLAETLQLSPLA